MRTHVQFDVCDITYCDAHSLFAVQNHFCSRSSLGKARSPLATIFHGPLRQDQEARPPLRHETRDANIVNTLSINTVDLCSYILYVDCNIVSSCVDPVPKSNR